MTFLTIELYRPRRDFKKVLWQLLWLAAPLIIFAAWAV